MTENRLLLKRQTGAGYLYTGGFRTAGRGKVLFKLWITSFENYFIYTSTAKVLLSYSDNIEIETDNKLLN